MLKSICIALTIDIISKPEATARKTLCADMRKKPSEKPNTKLNPFSFGVKDNSLVINHYSIQI